MDVHNMKITLIDAETGEDRHLSIPEFLDLLSTILPKSKETLDSAEVPNEAITEWVRNRGTETQDLSKRTCTTCANCQVQVSLFRDDRYYCHRDLRDNIDPVTGILQTKTTSGRLCQDERHGVSSNRCGKDGKFWVRRKDGYDLRKLRGITKSGTSF